MGFLRYSMLILLISINFLYELKKDTKFLKLPAWISRKKTLKNDEIIIERSRPVSLQVQKNSLPMLAIEQENTKRILIASKTNTNIQLDASPEISSLTIQKNKPITIAIDQKNYETSERIIVKKNENTKISINESEISDLKVPKTKTSHINIEAKKRKLFD